MKLLRIGFLLGVFSVSIVSCSGNDKPSMVSHQITCSSGEVTDYGIIGGRGLNKDTELARGIVFLYNSNENGSGYACTATLVDRNMILTAAHCVSGASTLSLRAFFTNQPACDAKAGYISYSMREVDRIEIHSAFQGKDVNAIHADIALVRLSSKAPKDFYPLQLNNEAIPFDDYSRFVVAGYGKTDPRQGYKEDDLFLRVVTLSPLSEYHRQELAVSAYSSSSVTARDYAPSSASEFIYLDQTQGRGLCMGDSGGPALSKNSQGNLVQVGVASHVLNIKNDGRVCAFASVETNVYYFKDWIESNFQSMKNSDSEKNTLFE